MADHINKFFINIGEDISSKVPNTNKRFESYLKNSNLMSIYCEDISTLEILEAINNIKNKKTSRPDLFSANVIKKTVAMFYVNR